MHDEKHLHQVNTSNKDTPKAVSHSFVLMHCNNTITKQTHAFVLSTVHSDRPMTSSCSLVFPPLLLLLSCRKPRISLTIRVSSPSFAMYGVNESLTS